MVDSDTLVKYSKDWLKRAELANEFNGSGVSSENADLVLTYFQYLKSKSYLRPLHNGATFGTVFVYSKVGRKRIENDLESLVDEFLKFYND